MERRQRDAECHRRVGPPRLQRRGDCEAVGRQPPASAAGGGAGGGTVIAASTASALALPLALDPQQIERWLARLTRGRVGVFLDYDGTLTPIVDRPEQATLAAGTRDRLTRLAERCPVTIVTGRDVAVMRGFVQLEQLGYAGCHGMDIDGPTGSGLRYEAAAALLPEVDSAERALRGALDGIDGVLVERKRYSVSTHYRLAAASDVARVDAAVCSVARAHSALRREGGKKVFELRPDIDWDKGRAVEWLIEALEIDPSSVVYIGDDETDEDVFRRLGGRGVSIVVAPADRPTAACYRVRDPGEVIRVLDLLIGALPRAR
ncbi:MAG: trehalose-phosphatase [Acidobacteria bacterium]|nr:trehalose-phosphatase [Acidobacteriota bacterium]